MIGSYPRLLGFCGLGGSGKTTLLTRVIPRLTGEGLRVGVIKHHGHGGALPPYDQGKDTQRLAQAGAAAVALIHAGGVWLNQPQPLPGDDPRQVAADLMAAQDLILLEGFKRGSWDKIEVVGPGAQPLLPPGGRLVALTRRGGGPGQAGLPVLDADQPQQVADFVLDWWRAASALQARLLLDGRQETMPPGLQKALARFLANRTQDPEHRKIAKMEIFFD